MENLHDKVKQFVKENERNIVQDIKDICAVKSLPGDAAPNAPFGDENRKALDLALAMSQRLGLDTKDCEGYLGYAEVKGESNGEKRSTPTQRAPARRPPLPL